MVICSPLTDCNAALPAPSMVKYPSHASVAYASQKHPIKVHVWVAISKRGATEICIFEGKMDAPFYIQILERYLLPFIHAR